MPYRRTQDTDKYGSASRTLTLPLSTWAALAETCEILEIPMKTAIVRSIAVFNAQTVQQNKIISE